jgi:hypothetical protein
MFGLNPFFLLYILILFLNLQDSSIELFSFFLFTKITEGDHQTDVIERVNEIYTAVVQSEECMEKIACEVGALAGDVGLTQSPALKIAGGFVPSKYKTYYKQFTAGKDCHKIKCGTFA